MSKWLLYLNNRNYWQFMHYNLDTGKSHNCGELRTDTAILMILEWILEQEVHTGDLIRLPNGEVLQMMKEAQS